MPNINTILREARESKGLSIKDAAKALKLRERHIEMLEEGRLHELSHEIYLKGFLKTYTSWLNIDGIDIITQINHEKKKSQPQRHDVPILSLIFSYISGLARSPGINLLVLSTILTIGIYVFWSKNHKNVEGADMISSLQSNVGEHANEKYTNILEEYRGDDLVFFPHGNVELKVVDTTTGEEKINQLSDGDIFFLKADTSTFLSSETPEAIEVFVDKGSQQESLGTLDKILIKF